MPLKYNFEFVNSSIQLDLNDLSAYYIVSIWAEISLSINEQISNNLKKYMQIFGRPFPGKITIQK